MCMNFLQRDIITLKDINVYCEFLLTEKPPLLLIHGFASSTYTFNRIVPLLKEHFSIVAIDLPGFGRSEKTGSFRYSFHNYASLIGYCLDYFQLNKSYIVGHSMGGQVALYFAKTAPERVNKLVLLNSSGYLKKANKSLIYLSYLPFFDYFLHYYIKRKAVHEHLKNVLFNQSLISEEMIEHFGKPLYDKNFYKALINLGRNREGDLMTSELNEINIPTLLLWGENDKVVPVTVGQQLVNDLPNATLITYPNTGHLITEERPQQVFEQILRHTKLA